MALSKRLLTPEGWTSLTKTQQGAGPRKSYWRMIGVKSPTAVASRDLFVWAGMWSHVT